MMGTAPQGPSHWSQGRILSKPRLVSAIRSPIHRDDSVYLDGTYRGQVNSEIPDTYNERGRYEELSDPKYIDIGGIFDIMAVTVIQQHLSEAA
jgi:hypothetical protein